MGKKRKKMRGTVEKIIKPVSPMEPEKAQITIPEADDLYREVRVENVVTDENGEKASLKPGAEVDSSLKQTQVPRSRSPRCFHSQGNLAVGGAFGVVLR